MSRQGQIPLGGEEVLHQPVGRGEEQRPARLHQPVADGAQGVGLAGARQSEGQHVDAAVDEAAVGQLVQLPSQRQGHPVVLEGLPGLACRQPRGGAQPADAPLPAVLGLLLQHFQESLQGISVSGGGEAGHRRAPMVGSRNWWHSSPNPVLYGCGVRHQATSASRAS